jgi:hypothetical protein
VRSIALREAGYQANNPKIYNMTSGPKSSKIDYTLPRSTNLPSMCWTLAAAQEVSFPQTPQLFTSAC